MGKKYEDYSDEFYANEGLAIIYKGKMIMGLHPDNVEQNLSKLQDGTVDFDWKAITDKSRTLLKIKK